MRDESCTSFTGAASWEQGLGTYLGDKGTVTSPTNYQTNIPGTSKYFRQWVEVLVLIGSCPIFEGILQGSRSMHGCITWLLGNMSMLFGQDFHSNSDRYDYRLMS